MTTTPLPFPEGAQGVFAVSAERGGVRLEGPHAPELLLAALGDTAVPILGLESNGVVEHEGDDNLGDNGRVLWSAGRVEFAQTYAVARRYKPFLTFFHTSRIRAHAGEPRWLSRDDHASLTVSGAEWSETPVEERPARFPYGGPIVSMSYGVDTKTHWRVHQHADDPFTPPDGYALYRYERGLKGGKSSSVRNLDTVDQAWLYARHIAASIDASDLASIGVMKALEAF